MLRMWFMGKFPALLVLAIIVASALQSSGLILREGSVVINVVFHGRDGGVVADFLGVPTVPPGTVVYAQVLAVAPPQLGVPEVELFVGELYDNTLRIPAEGLFLKIIKYWVEDVESSLKGLSGRARETILNSFGAGLQVNLWVVNVTNHAVLQKVSKYITYNPVKVLAGETIKHTLNILLTNQAPQYVPFKNLKTCGSPTCVAGNVSNREVKVIKPEDTIGCAIRFRWEPQYYIAPENNTAVFGNDIKYYNGEYYVKMSILLTPHRQLSINKNWGIHKSGLQESHSILRFSNYGVRPHQQIQERWREHRGMQSRKSMGEDRKFLRLAGGVSWSEEVCLGLG
ncbi:MAG: hypothetical protein J7J11_02180 [Desulfurococcales archaeon]|nr:hypothetical protein [Desulfurococcales archaeon]